MIAADYPHIVTYADTYLSKKENDLWMLFPIFIKIGNDVIPIFSTYILIRQYHFANSVEIYKFSSKYSL